MPLSSFPARRFEFILEAEAPLLLPPYKGSTLRGAFGHAFRRVACAVSTTTCDACLLKERCVYIHVFETPVDPGERSRGVNTFAPHPFVLEPPLDPATRYRLGEKLSLGIVLIGRALDLLPYFIHAVEAMGRLGLGKGRGKARLAEVRCDGIVVYDAVTRSLYDVPSNRSDGVVPGGDRVAVEFLTPLRLVVRDHFINKPTFVDFVEALVKRADTLARYHSGNGLPERGLAALGAAREVRLTSAELRWYDWERWSARQETRMKMGGVVGRMEVEGVPDVLRPWLRLGELIHVGKGTSFGLGRYRVEGRK